MIRDYINSQTKTLQQNPVSAVGIGGFELFARVAESTKFSASAPTSVLEDGSFTGDDIIIAPFTVTITGEVSDIYIKGADNLFNLIPPAVPEALGAVSAYLPNWTNGQLSKITGLISDVDNRINQIDSAIAAGQKAVNLIGNESIGKSIQDKFLDKMETMFSAGQPIEIEMYGRIRKDMAIINLDISRDNQENAYKFSMTAQQLRFNELIYSEISDKFPNPSPATKEQIEAPANKGAQAPTREKSLATIFRNFFFGGGS